MDETARTALAGALETAVLVPLPGLAAAVDRHRRQFDLTASWGAQAGERWYAGRGVRVSSEYPAGVEHTLGGRLGATVARVVDGG